MNVFKGCPGIVFQENNWLFLNFSSIMKKQNLSRLNKCCKILLQTLFVKKEVVNSYFIFLILICHNAGAQEIPFITNPEKDYHNNICIYLQEKAEEISESALTDITSLDYWENEKDSRYAELIHSLGLNYMPLNEKRPDMNVTYTGKIQMNGYHIEKLYFESLPLLYVPAKLYIPSGWDNLTENPGGEWNIA